MAADIMTSSSQTSLYSEQDPQQGHLNSSRFGGRLNPLVVSTTAFNDHHTTPLDAFLPDWGDKNVSSSGTTMTTMGGLPLCPVDEGNTTGYGSEFYATAQMVTGLFIYPSFCFPGLIGNILTVVVLSQRNMLTSTNAFLSALAVSDSIKLINDSLYFFVTLFFNIDPVLGNLSYGYLYPYAHFIFSMSVCVSSWLTVSVAVERYILVCHPTRARNFWSRRRAVTLCCIIYVVMTSLALPSAFRYRTIRCFDVQMNASKLEVELTEMWQDELFVTSYTWAQNLLRSIIPLVVLVVLNVCIIRAVRRTKIKKKRKNSRHRVTIMMIVVILTFMICITPDAILSTIFGRGYHEAGMVTKGIREITDTLLTINAAVNFIIYCALNKVFRKSFTHLCCPRSKRQGDGWVTEMDESVYRRFSEAKVSTLSSNNNHSTHRKDPETQSENVDTNNSPFSPSTPKSAVSTEDNSRFRYNSLSGGPSSPESPGFSSERLALFASPSTKQQACMSDSVKSDGFAEKYNQRRRQNNKRSLNNQQRNSWNDSHNHHHHHHQVKHPKSSSHGLKKSRNSVKCNRSKRSLSNSSGDKNFSNDNYDVFQNEAVTYVPKEEFQNSLRRLSSGRQYKRHSALKSIDQIDIPEAEVKANSEKRLVLDLNKHNGDDVKIDSSTSSCCPLSPDSAPYTPHNRESPGTFDSDITNDDQQQQSDDITQINDLPSIVHDNVISSPDEPELISSISSSTTYNDDNNPLLPKQNGSVMRNGTSTKDNGDEAAVPLNSRDLEDCDATQNTRHSEWEPPSGQHLNENNKIKKRPLTVSFSDC